MDNTDLLDMLQDTWLGSPIPHTLKHKYDGFWERVEEEKRKAMLTSAREFEEDTPWKEICKQLKGEDIDFIREFKNHISWDEVDKDVLWDPKIRKEFGREIDEEREWKMKVEMKTMEMMLHL